LGRRRHAGESSVSTALLVLGIHQQEGMGQPAVRPNKREEAKEVAPRNIYRTRPTGRTPTFYFFQSRTTPGYLY